MSKTINYSQQAKSSPQARGRRLKSLRMMADLSRKEMESRYHISAGTIQCWEDGRYGGLTEKGARRFSSAIINENIHCTVEWLLHGVGMGPYISERIELLSLSCSEPTENTPPYIQSTSEEEALYEELCTFCRVNINAVNMKVNDDAMMPRFRIGDYVGGRRYYGDDMARFVNYPCIIESTRGDVLLRCFRLNSKTGVYELFGIDPDCKIRTEGDIEFASVAPVLWHRIAESNVVTAVKEAVDSDCETV